MEREKKQKKDGALGQRALPSKDLELPLFAQVAGMSQSRCVSCGREFQYLRKGRTRWVCETCRAASALERDRRRRRRWKLLPTEARNNHREVKEVARLSRQEAARLLKTSAKVVELTEREAFFKLRNHPALRELWERCKEEAGEGPMLPAELGMQGDAGEDLLRWQLEVAEFWATQEQLSANGCEEEALECAREISQCQQAIKRALAVKVNL